jgi:hypothetical protein
VDERALLPESQATKPDHAELPVLPDAGHVRLNWIVRTKKDRLPGGADERDRAKFAKAQSYMVLVDNQAMCKNRAMPEAVRYFRR